MLFRSTSKDWYYKGVMMLKEAGLLSDYSSQLNPNEALSREEMGALVGRYLKHLGYTDANLSVMSVFKDTQSISTQNYLAIALAVDHGILTGSNSLFMPKNHMSREQATAILYKLMSK